MITWCRFIWLTGICVSSTLCVTPFTYPSSESVNLLLLEGQRGVFRKGTNIFFGAYCWLTKRLDSVNVLNTMPFSLALASLTQGVQNTCYGIEINTIFHGVPWNLERANFDDTIRFMEFYGTLSGPISLARSDPWNPMEFHWTYPVNEMGHLVLVNLQ